MDYRLFEGADDGIVAVGEWNCRFAKSSMRGDGAGDGIGAVGERNRDCQVDRKKCSCGNVDRLNLYTRCGDRIVIASGHVDRLNLLELGLTLLPPAL